MRLGFQAAVILSVLSLGVWTSSVSADVHVKGMLSTGQTFDGKLMKDDGRRLVVKEEKRTSILPSVNVAECTVLVSDEKIPADAAGLPGSGLGKFMLSKGHRFLAEATFLCALTRTARTDTSGGLKLALWARESVPLEKILEVTQISSVKAMYEETRQRLPAGLGGRKTSTWRPRRYQLPPPMVITGVLKQIDEWGRKMKRIAPKTHRVETAHFIIYSAWAKSDDTKLKGIYEKLYIALCKQFDMPATDNIWIGKLPVFAFWEKKDFVSFSVTVCGASTTRAQQAGGFAGRRGWCQYVCLGPVMRRGMNKNNARTWFYELLVHESTHAFLARYINSNSLVNWLNEGIAEMLSATFVPKGGTSYKLQSAHAAVKRGKGSQFLSMFTAKNIPLDGVHYGAAQSLVRFLVFKDKSKFIQLVYEIKGGAGSEDALRKVYGLTHKELLRQWVKKTR